TALVRVLDLCGLRFIVVALDPGNVLTAPSVLSRLDVARSRRFRQKGSDAFGDLAGVCLYREVAGVQESNERLRNIALERLSAPRQKERVVLAPHRQKRRLVGAEVFLK